MEIKTDARRYSEATTVSMTVLALKENKRPVGFAPWPEPEPEPKKGKKK